VLGVLQAARRGDRRLPIPVWCRAMTVLLLAAPLLAPAVAGAAPDATPAAPVLRLVFYWGTGCPHCEHAKPFVQMLAAEYPAVTIETVEIRRDPAQRRRFLAHMAALQAGPPAIPAFVVHDAVVVGFQPGQTEAAVRNLLDTALGRTAGTGAAAGPVVVSLPLLGTLDLAHGSFPAFTVAIGLVDGLNPCAMWVLLVMLSILLHVRSRARLLLFGATFVVMSGVVYFLFMTAWTGLFALAGMSRLLTQALGAALLGLGLINLKELVWFRTGPTLTIPDAAKPGLYRRARSIAAAASLPAAFLGIAALAFVVNLIELGCTIGLPAVYTRILTLRVEPSTSRYAYLVLYNLAYVVPLALIVLAYGLTLHRFVLTEGGAKVLKTISGVLLTVFGVLFLLRPELLQ